MLEAAVGQVPVPPVDEATEAVDHVAEATDQYVLSAIAFAVVYLVGRYVVTPAIVRVVRARNPNNSTMTAATQRYLAGFFAVVAFVVAVTVAGYGPSLSRSAILVAAASVTLGIAGQDAIGNLVSGVFLVADKDFNVGDHIEWNEYTGVVVSIRYRTTQVRTAEGHEVTIPNTELSANAFVRPYNRRRVAFSERLPFGYAVDVDRASAVLERAVLEAEGVRDHPRPAANVDEFCADVVWVNITYWVGNPREADVAEIRGEAADRLKRACDEWDLPVSPPTDHRVVDSVEVTEQWS
ncbi:Small-conductance mechanosensitive channel [Halopelagius inordinatus]|uniref:Small-conductance mechanosensitive channel n=1 Tax=Halopelagius inordinatus TaxID=553467 RepID=A0A1I2LV67_9EURY|nr:mechanosensitive ion channel domain-containing protein [Halopelagius inordinatus]SFF83174.1 Small-conductance mechanosensitive channel [Halopelagius inordinatus]